jgi:SDR family mycofactocin-dependent oxidoreductase
VIDFRAPGWTVRAGRVALGFLAVEREALEMELLDGKVAVVSGAARGQGRAHAVRLAQEGADIIAMDICADIDTVHYPLATSEELQETVAQVERLDRRIVATETDVRDAAAVAAAIDTGVEQLGRLDIVIANAGIAMYDEADKMSEQSWQDMIGTNLTGVWTVCRASMPHMIEGGRGGAMVLISSVAAHVGMLHLSHYSAAKAGVVGLMRSLAVELAPHMIRVNTIHPTSVNTRMIINEATYDLLAPGSGAAAGNGADAAPADVIEGFKGINAMPVAWVEPDDISNAVLYLVSDAGRYVTGTQLSVDGGAAAK